MSYIYDIILNFHEHYYEFFEWRRNDKIKNIIKIPLIRVSDNDILNFKNNKIKVDKNFINKIKENNNKTICLVSNTKITIGLLFDNNGTLLKRSSLIYEEDNEVNNICKNLKTKKITYIENTPIPLKNKLRLEIERKDIILNYIKKEKDIQKLKYLFYEYFKKENNNINQIKESFIKELEQEWNQKQNNLYNLVKLLNRKNLLTK